MTATNSSANAPISGTAVAEAALRAQLVANPTLHATALALADLLLGDGRVKEALALLTEHAGDRTCGDRLREYYIGERMNDAASRLLERRSPEASASGLVDQALRFQLRGDLDAAITHCRLALKADASYAPARNHLGRALFNKRQTAAAGAAFVHAVRLDPEYAEAWHNLAHTLRDAKDWEQAERSYGHALRLRPAYRSALLNIGIVRAAMGKSEQALENFLALAALEPANAAAHFNAGLCQHLLRQGVAAEQSYLHAIELDPRNPAAYLQLGRLYYEYQDIENALELFRKALDVNPHDAEAWTEIAIALEKADRIDEAERAIAAGLASAPDDPGLRIELANIARRRGDPGTALAGLRQIDPQALHPIQHSRHRDALELALAAQG